MAVFFPSQWEHTVDRLEQNLGLEGHARFQVEHEKKGRTHRHVVWSRIDPETMTATPDSYNYLVHNQTREELEREFDHEPTPPPPERGTRIRDWEYFRAQESGIDPKDIKAEVTALWKVSDSGAAFQSALEDAGYTLCKGDKRDFCIIDPAGDVHSLARRVEGVKAAEIRERMSGIDPATLPSVKEASEFVKAQASDAPQPNPVEQPQAREAAKEEEPAQFMNPKLQILEKFAHDHPPLAPPATYPVATSAQELSEMSHAMLRAGDGELPFARSDTWQEWGQHAWDTLRARVTHALEKLEDKSTDLWQEWTGRLPEQHTKDERELERER